MSSMNGKATQIYTVGDLRKALKGIPANRIITCDHNETVILSFWDAEKRENIGCNNARKFVDISSDEGLLEGAEYDYDEK